MRLRRVLVFIKSDSGLRDQTGGRTGPFNKKSVDSDQEWSSPLPNVPVSVLTWVRVAYLSYAKSLAKEDLPKESVSR
jgi:basic membrane lipoprotein Med (substrate-binding protein (PBP1-ABC) superfamily)